uniref:Uncharacterized protein n=1 Tax=Zea mays TaxID=4577 RepID=B7ZY78_MAIZE|nr:unknown [Zea mays]
MISRLSFSAPKLIVGLNPNPPPICIIFCASSVAFSSPRIRLKRPLKPNKLRKYHDRLLT